MSHPLSRRQLLAGLPLLAAGIAPAIAAATGSAPQPWYVPRPHPQFPRPDPPQPAAGAARRLLHWSRTVLRLVVKYQQNPLRAARALAYVQVASHDAWLHAGASGACVELAMHRAASHVLGRLYPHETPGQFEAQFAALRSRLGLSPGTQAAEALGTHVGDALVQRSLRDGADRHWAPRMRPAPFPGAWEPTFPLYAAVPAEGMAGHWQRWLADSAGRHDPAPPPRPGSPRHREETREVLAVARALDDAQRQSAHDWHLDAGSVTPGGVWMGMALERLDAARPHLPEATAVELQARLTAALAVAMADALADCWRVKMRDWSERPITAVRRELDAGFVPLLVTPSFPAYVSGHAAVSGAAAAVLSWFFPAEAAHFEARAADAAMSRLWGGIHFRCDNEEGLRLGRATGLAVARAAGAGPRI